MGLISKALTLILSFLLFLSFILGSVSFIIYSSLEYNEVQKNAAPYVETFLRESIITEQGEINKDISATDRVLDAILSSKWGKEIPFTESLKRSLEEKMKSPNLDNVSLKEESEELIHEVYYKKYECNYWDCAKKYEVPYFFISQQSRDYWYQKFKYALSGSLILMGALFLLVSKKRNFFVLVGILSLLTSLVLLGIKRISSSSIKLIGSEIFNIFFNKSGEIIKLLAIAGIILIALAIILGLFGFGFKIFSWLDNIKVRLPKQKKKIKKGKSRIKEQEEE